MALRSFSLRMKEKNRNKILLVLGRLYCVQHRKLQNTSCCCLVKKIHPETILKKNTKNKHNIMFFFCMENS